MDYWQSMELSSARIRQFSQNLGILKNILDDLEKRTLFFNRFPFDQLLNISTLQNVADVKMCAKILDFFTSYADFNNNDRINYVVEFTLLNLNQTKFNSDGMHALLDLLLKILQRNPTFLESSFKHVFDADKILETLLKISKRNCFEDYCLLISSIFKHIIGSSFPESTNLIVTQLFQELQRFISLEEQIEICQMIFKNTEYWCETFEVIYQWLIDCSPFLISITTGAELLDKIIDCILLFIKHWVKNHSTDHYSCTRYWIYIDKLYNNLVTRVSDICIQYSNTNQKCITLLKFLVLKFLDNDKLGSVIQDQIINDIDLLSEDVECWPKENRDIFFCICHICIEYSNMVWKESDVLNAIMKCFYNRRDVIKTFILKSIYYIYPKLLYKKDSPKPGFKILGDDLLYYFTKVCSVSYLYSFNCEQLTWMLMGASHSVKLNVLTEWLLAVEKNESLESILISTIKQCKSEIVLLHLIMDTKNLNTTIASRSAMLLNRLPSNKISYFATVILPFAIEKPISFYYFLVADPNTYLDPSKSLLIASLMGAILPTVSDIQVLKGASIFSAKLLARNKNNPDVVKGFCRNVSNIQYLVEVLDKIDDETGTEVIKLLKIFALVQHMNKINFGNRVKSNFTSFLVGSPEKIKSGLGLLYHVLVFKFSIIHLDMKHVLEIYDSTLDYSFNQFLHNAAYLCVVTFIKRIPWLAQTVNTAIYLEMACFSDFPMKMNIFKILDVWLLQIRGTPYNGFSPIPVMSIRSFVMRGHLNEYETEKYVSMLRDLEKKEEKLMSFSSIFSH